VYYRKDNTTLVVKNKQKAGAHKITSATSSDHKETRDLQHTKETSRRRSSTGKILKILRNVKKTFKQRTFIHKF
jgi:hypothetical protein